MKYTEKYGVSRASRSYIYFWKQRWDGSVASLACHARRCTASSMAQGLKHYA